MATDAEIHNLPQRDSDNEELVALTARVREVDKQLQQKRTETEKENTPCRVERERERIERSER